MPICPVAGWPPLCHRLGCRAYLWRHRCATPSPEVLWVESCCRRHRPHHPPRVCGCPGRGSLRP
eukprot:1782452-Pleurochrysis_carterae.AAC.1